MESSRAKLSSLASLLYLLDIFRYHSNIGKDQGLALFHLLCQAVRDAVASSGSTGRVVNGTYGNIQRMRDLSNDGPYSHVFDV